LGEGYLIAGEIEIGTAPSSAEPMQLSSQQLAPGETISGLQNVFGRYPNAIISFEAMLASRLSPTQRSHGSRADPCREPLRSSRLIRFGMPGSSA
jgi:hypothetical protein